MEKEAKWNVVFLTILIIVLIPGAVILVKKKLDPNSRRMGGPDPVRKTTAYIDPFEVPEDFRRLVPPKAESWTASLVPAGLGDVLSYKGTPVVSEAKQFQVLSFARNAKGIEFVALIWNLPEGKPVSSIKAKAAVGGDPVDALQIDQKLLAVPIDLREELRGTGFIKPPQNAILVTAQFPDLPNPTLKKPAELMLQAYQDGPTKPDFVRIFTNPVEVKQDPREEKSPIEKPPL